MPTLSSKHPRRSLIIKGLNPSGTKVTTTTITHINDQATDEQLLTLGYKFYNLSINQWAGTFKQDLTDIVIQDKARPYLWYDGNARPWITTANASFAEIKAATTANGKFTMEYPLVLIAGVGRTDRGLEMQRAEIDTIRTIITNNTNFVFINLKFDKEIYDEEHSDVRRFYNIELAAGGTPTTGTISITTNEVVGYDQARPFTLTIKE